MIRYIVKHFDYKEEDIAKEKYKAWDLILPFWDNVNVFEGIDKYYKRPNRRNLIISSKESCT